MRIWVSLPRVSKAWCVCQESRSGISIYVYHSRLKGLQREDGDVVLTMERQTTEWSGSSGLPTCMMNAAKTVRQMLDLRLHDARL